MSASLVVDTRPSISVVICAYTTKRWDSICKAVDSVLVQSYSVLEVLLVIDNNDALFELASSRYDSAPSVRVLANAETKGLSGARNTGVTVASGDVVAFLDDDAHAEIDWAAAMAGHYVDPAVAGVGGAAAAEWPDDSRPAWLPNEFDWVVGCSYVGQPTTVAPIRNFMGCNMSIRRETFAVAGAFSSSIGRVGTVPLGCEETELCIRIRQTVPGAALLFDPTMVVHHSVSSDRTEFRYFLRRCYNEGLSKALVADLVGADDALSSERDYTLKVLPRAVLRGLFCGNIAGVGRAAAVVIGLAVTTAGYVTGKARLAFGRK